MTRKQPTLPSVNRALKGSRVVDEAVSRILGAAQPPATEVDRTSRDTCRNCMDRVHVPDERTGLIHVTGKYVCNRGVKYGRAERIYVAERKD